MTTLRSIVTTGLAAGLLATTNAALAQTPDIPQATYPRLAARGAGAGAFVPPGWVIEDSARVDLDGDGRPDLVFVLRQTDPRNVIASLTDNDGKPLDTNPRLLGVALADAAGQGYTLLLQDHALIPRHTDPAIDDPFDGLTARTGSFRIGLRFWASMGSWEAATRSFAFRVEQGCVRLIGHDASRTNRATAQVTMTSINLLTGNVVTMAERPDDRATPKPRTSVLRQRERICLGQIGDGLGFDPQAGTSKPR